MILLLAAADAGALTTATWTGGAGTTSYNNPANWDTPDVPVNTLTETYAVVIPGGVTVEFDVPGVQEVTDFQLGSDATLVVNPGRSLTVLDFAEVYGRVTTDNGTFDAPAPAAQFPGNEARAHVSGGGAIAIAAPSYSSTGLSSRGTYAILSADGAGSVLDLSSLAALFDNHNYTAYEQRHQITATNSGVVDLSGVQSISGPTREGSDRLDIVITTNGNVMLDALQSTTAGTGEVRFDLNLPSYTLPSLTDANQTRFILADAMTLHVPVLETHNGEGFTLGDNATVDAPLLESLTWSEIHPGAGATFDAPNLVDISGTVVNVSPAWTLQNATIVNLDNARLSVSGGAQFGTAFSDIAAASYSSAGLSGRGTYAVLSADGTGSVLDLSSLTTLLDNHNYTAYEQRHQVVATNGGVVDLSNVQSISGPTREEDDRLDIVVNTGGDVVLGALQSTTAGTGEVRFDLDVPTYTLPALETTVNTQFNVADGRTLNLPLLVSHNGEGYGLGDGALVDAPSLVSLTNAVLSAGAGATFDAPNLVDISGSVVNPSPAWTLTRGTLANLDNARVSVSGGLVFDDISAASYSSAGLSGRGTYAVLAADGTGSVLDLSSLTTLLDNHNYAAYEQRHQVVATDGGLVNLSNVQSIAGPMRESQDRLDFIVNTGGHIDLSSLQSVTTGNGEVRFVVSAGGQLTLGEVTVTDDFSLSVADNTSRVDFVGGLNLDATSDLNVSGLATVALGGHFSFDYTDEAAMACDEAVFQFDGGGQQWLEVGGEDLGPAGLAGTGNFGIAQLVVGGSGATEVLLVDAIDNGNRASNEALYLYGSGGLDGLDVLTGSTLVIGDINVYALIDGEQIHVNEWFGESVTSVAFRDGWVALPEPATLALVGLGGVAMVLLRRRR
jgi:hypothetical protein